MRRLSVMVFVVTVVLAGCNGVIGGDGESSATLTPAAVPTDEPTPTPAPRLAPGLRGDGIENADALAAAHDTMLENTSFTRRLSVTYRDANGTLRERTLVRSHVAADGRFSVVLERPIEPSTDHPDPERERYYFDGTHLLAADTYANGTTVYRNASTDYGPVRRAYAESDGEEIAGLFEGRETRVVRIERNGTERYQVVSEGPAPQRRSDGSRGLPPNRSVRAFVDPEGLIHEVRLNRTGGVGGNGRTTASLGYSGVGTTIVERPPWYAEAIT